MFGFLRKVPSDHVGEVTDIFEKIGKYQIYQFIIVCLSVLFLSMTSLNYVFLARDLDHRCVVPECETPPYIFSRKWWPHRFEDRCSKPVLKHHYLTNDSCSLSSFTGQRQQCSAWVYESHRSMVVDLNLACQPLKISLIGTIHNLGMMISVLVLSIMADSFGRKPIMIISVLGTCVGHFKPLVTNYYIYVFVEFVEACFTGGFYTVGLHLLVEICGRKNRLISGTLFTYSLYLGEIVLSCIAMPVNDWKILTHIIYTPALVLLIFLIFFLNESPRWLVMRGRSETVKELLVTMAKTNNLNIEEDKIRNIDEQTLKDQLDIGDISIDKKQTTTQAFASKEILKRFVLHAFPVFAIALVDFGITLNSVYLPGNKYINYMLTTILSMPGELLSYYIMNKFGRKWPLFICMFSGGLFCIASGLTPIAYMITKKAFFYLSKIFIAVTFTGQMTYAIELYPTSVRGSLGGIGALIGRFGALFSPLTTVLNSMSIALPPLVLGVVGVLASFAYIFTPETKDLPLMETIEDLENSVKKNKEKTEVNEIVITPELVYYKEVSTYL